MNMHHQLEKKDEAEDVKDLEERIFQI